ncbi:RDD family protein [Vogesella sp. LIG4]|uniref:RDD family protein n=1 Tax=Vogesella sp. LIG4 TaxID=1192162 RepID=UPI0008202287|nr:RDD family protein [Vogesella sp. LIG4]SCK13830.1 Uncharacterized membrane protein YckC, RDD family [Vogesella sp. LIG4]
MTSAATPGLPRRFASLCYELLLLAAIVFTVAAVFTPLLTWGNHALPLEWLYKLTMAAVLYGYFGYCWVKSGQTPAMKTWRIKLVTRDDGPLGWPHAAVRFVVALMLFVGVPIISFLAWQRASGETRAAMWIAMSWWLLPLLWPFTDPDRQFLHDRLAGTRQIVAPRGERS